MLQKLGIGVNFIRLNITNKICRSCTTRHVVIAESSALYCISLYYVRRIMALRSRIDSEKGR